MLLYQTLAFTIHGIIQKSHTKTIKFMISASKSNEQIELPDGAYSVLDIFKKHKEKDDNPSIRIYVNKIENRITFKIKTG